MRAKAKSSSTPYPIWIEGEYITEPPIRPKDGAVRPTGHYIDKGGYPGANVYSNRAIYLRRAVYGIMKHRVLRMYLQEIRH